MCTTSLLDCIVEHIDDVFGFIVFIVYCCLLFTVVYLMLHADPDVASPHSCDSDAIYSGDPRLAPHPIPPSNDPPPPTKNPSPTLPEPVFFPSQPTPNPLSALRFSFLFSDQKLRDNLASVLLDPQPTDKAIEHLDPIAEEPEPIPVPTRKELNSLKKRINLSCTSFEDLPKGDRKQKIFEKACYFNTSEYFLLRSLELKSEVLKHWKHNHPEKYDKIMDRLNKK